MTRRKKPQKRGSTNPVKTPSDNTKESSVSKDTESENPSTETASQTTSGDQGPVEGSDTPASQQSKPPEKSNEDKALSGGSSTTQSPAKKTSAKKETKKEATATELVEADSFFVELVAFKKAMEGKRPGGQEYARLQKGVNRTFLNTLVLDAKASKERLSLLLDYLHENKTVLSGPNLCLYPSHWSAGQQAYNRYTGLVHLFTKTANSKTRKKEMKNISMERLFDRNYPANVQANLIAFYL